MDKNTVVILIIVHKTEITKFEKISIEQCFNVLGNYDIVFICPMELDVTCYRNINNEANFNFIDSRWQSSYFNFNRLKIEPFLYKLYSKYEYILFYEPDAYVINDNLYSWINKGYDNIGGPWLSLKTGQLEPYSGNGGFCLRNVGAAITTLQSNTLLFLPKIVWNMVKELPFRYWWKYKFILLRLLFPIFQGSKKFIERYPFYEDKFWAKIAPIINKDFKVCPATEAMKFAFDAHPDKFFKLNKGQLPMGAHGWYRPERIDFWKDHIEELKQINP